MMILLDQAGHWGKPGEQFAAISEILPRRDRGHSLHCAVRPLAGPDPGLHANGILWGRIYAVGYWLACAWFREPVTTIAAFPLTALLLWSIPQPSSLSGEDANYRRNLERWLARFNPD